MLSAAAADPEATAYRPQDVALVVEVTTRATAPRDRARKPQIYAQAGIQNLWRVEDVDGQPAVYAYVLDQATGTYTPAGFHHARLKTRCPFEVDIDLTEATRI